MFSDILQGVSPSTWNSIALIGCTTAVMMSPAVLLVKRILWPTIISHPWKFPDSEQGRRKDKHKVVVLAGSFNPPHLGHLAMLEYLAERYGEVIAVVGMNPDKKYVVTPTERAQFIQDMISEKGIKGKIRVEGPS